jgi:catechol 2,3-dioxygenase-like lactoylglutathione lyase family enzyme
MQTQMSEARVDILLGAAYFPVADVASTGAYFRDVLGFGCEYAAGDPPEFAVYARGGCAIMFRRVADPALISPNEKQGGTWDVFCWVSNVEALLTELQGRGAIFACPLTVQPYGMTEFAVRDPNGYVLGFGQTTATVTQL